MPDATIHNWIYVIIPVDSTYINRGTNHLGSVPLFSAFCKQCRSYFTEAMTVGEYGEPRLSTGSLPRYGCNPISDDVTAIP